MSYQICGFKLNTLFMCDIEQFALPEINLVKIRTDQCYVCQYAVGYIFKNDLFRGFPRQNTGENPVAIENIFSLLWALLNLNPL
jgi:hypothetical protein